MYLIIFGNCRKFMQYFNIYFRFTVLLILYYKSILSNINIYEATVPDRMHHLDLGLFHYQIDYTRVLLKNQYGNSLVDEVDRRLAAIPRFPGLKIFTNGLQARLTADEYRNLMKVMVFVVDNLYKENTKGVKNFIKNKDLTQVYVTWNEMYAISRYEMFKESDLVKFKVRINYANKIRYYIELN